jgi:hypothetical protein
VTVVSLCQDRKRNHHNHLIGHPISIEIILFENHRNNSKGEGQQNINLEDNRK